MDSRILLKQRDVVDIAKSMAETGVFVTCGLDTPNLMVTHWGTVGRMWGRQIFTLPIRSTKYSYQIVSKTKSFALNVPARDMRTEISLCDTMSGFKCNKFETLNLHPRRAKKIDAYILAECGLIVEYKVIAVIPPENIEQRTDGLFVGNHPHTLFVGEPVDVYRLR